MRADSSADLRFFRRGVSPFRPDESAASHRGVPRLHRRLPGSLAVAHHFRAVVGSVAARAGAAGEMAGGAPTAGLSNPCSGLRGSCPQNGMQSVTTKANPATTAAIQISRHRRSSPGLRAGGLKGAGRQVHSSSIGGNFPLAVRGRTGTDCKLPRAAMQRKQCHFLSWRSRRRKDVAEIQSRTAYLSAFGLARESGYFQGGTLAIERWVR